MGKPRGQKSDLLRKLGCVMREVSYGNLELKLNLKLNLKADFASFASLEYLGVLALETCFYALLVDSVKEKPGGREIKRIDRGWILLEDTRIGRVC